MSIPLRVRHLLSPKKISLCEFIISQLEISSEYFFELLDLGAIYLNQNRCFSDSALSPGDYVRVHISPKRFPILEKTEKELVVAKEKDFIVINKPQGYPCHPLVDNCREDLLSQLERILKTRLFLTHRLDIGTGGLWLLGLTPEFQKSFNHLLQQKKIHKKYVARVENRWTQTDFSFVHYMKPALRAPREVFNQAEEGFLKCELEVDEVLGHQNDLSDLKLKLLTGRTHQIRAQMAFLGHPVMGDVMYGSKFNFRQGPLERWALWSTDLEFENWKFRLSEKEFLRSWPS
jgi:23S rRNA pseudouridine1911/1915/1917 synthase